MSDDFDLYVDELLVVTTPPSIKIKSSALRDGESERAAASLSMQHSMTPVDEGGRVAPLRWCAMTSSSLQLPRRPLSYYSIGPACLCHQLHVACTVERVYIYMAGYGPGLRLLRSLLGFLFRCLFAGNLGRYLGTYDVLLCCTLHIAWLDILLGMWRCQKDTILYAGIHRYQKYQERSSPFNKNLVCPYYFLSY